MRINITLLSLFLLTSIGYSQHSIIPHPTKIDYLQGSPFVLDNNVIVISDMDFLAEANIIVSLVSERFNVRIGVAQRALEGQSVISIKKVNGVPKEGYRLSVSENECTILASNGAGALYGGITLSQMIAQDKERKELVIQSAKIEDAPRFGWRGIMMDCSRTFLPVDFLKKTIDRMAFYKLNVLHLHLTDDQGWRLEIKKRLNLTSEGAYFAESANQPKEYEGFYTQDDIRDLIIYATHRHVQIVPEIEVPTHSRAALYAYPELSCTKEKMPIYPYRRFREERDFCAGNEGTYSFFEDVLGEVTSLFPSPYVHLGGDERNITEGYWEHCMLCQKRIKELNLKNEDHLQRYVMDRVGKNVTKVNKRLIGWDEVMDGNISSDWIIMAWRNEDKCLEALQKGYEVIMTPTSHMYFDYSYSTTPTKKVYAYNPFPQDITEEQKIRVLGIQANFWTHIDRWSSRIDYQLYPRTLALSERAWSDA